MPTLRRNSSFARSSTSVAALAATVLCAGLAWAPAATAQQVLVDGVAEPDSPNVVNQVSLANGEVLTLDPGASIITAGDAVVAAAAGSTITVNNDGTITSTGANGILAFGNITDLNNSGTISGDFDGIFTNGNITDLNNSGTISGGSTGIFTIDDITDLNNSGTISGGSTGIIAFGNITDLNNSGTISGTSSGIEGDGNITGLTNSGTISGGDDGIQAADNITGLNNSGTISGDDDGIFADGNITDLNNSGTISGDNDGIQANSNISDLNNSGTISGDDDGIQASGNITDLNNSGTISGDDDGIEGDGNITGLNNSGTISGDDDGIDVDGNITGLNNSGTISGASRGIDVDGNITGLTNSGTISGAFRGIEVAGNITGLNNSGTISGGTYGIFTIGDITDLNNSGTISGGTYGIFTSRDITDLNNSGTIKGGDTGISADTITSLTNSGIIIGDGGVAIEEQGAGDTVLTLLAGSNIQGKVDLGGGVNTLVVGNGLNMVTTFEDAPDVVKTDGSVHAVSGSTVAVVDPSGFAVADNAVSGVASSVASSVTAHLNETGTTSVAGNQSVDASGVAVTPVGATPGDAPYGSSPNAVWLKAFGGLQEVGASGSTAGAQHLFGGFVFGIDRKTSHDLRLGVFGGIAAGQVEIDGNIQDIDSDSYFGGVYGRHEVEGWWVDFAVTAGVSAQDSTRVVANNQVAGGLEKARGNYNGWFVAPEVTFGTEVEGLGRTFKPSLRTRYVGMWFDDYTETGSAANLSVDDRDVHTLEARFQLALPLVDNSRRNFELRVGVDGRVALGNEKVSASLLAQQIEFSPGGADERLDGFIGASYADRLSANTQVFVSSELGTGTETDIQATAQAGIRVNF